MRRPVYEVPGWAVVYALQHPRLPRHERVLRRALLAGAAMVAARIVWGLL